VRTTSSAVAANLTDEDRRELAELLRRLLGETKYPYSPEAQKWRELLGKLDSEAVKPAAPSPPRTYECRAT
jgi:hypothetical protein